MKGGWEVGELQPGHELLPYRKPDGSMVMLVTSVGRNVRTKRLPSAADLDRISEEILAKERTQCLETQ